MTVIRNQHKCSYERTHSGWQAKRCCDWLDVQPHSYHQPVYMQQTPSRCTGKSKILTVLLLAGWNGYSLTKCTSICPQTYIF